MSDQRDEFYQPWLREPAASSTPQPKRRYEPDAGSALGRDEAVPLGVDVSGYALEEKVPPPLPERIKPAARAASDTAAKLLAASGRSARSFADWTIALGERADVPSRVAALEIPRRSGVAAQRSGRMLAAAGRAFAAATGRAGTATAAGLGTAGQRLKQSIGRAASDAKSAASRRMDALRAASADTPPPHSGLDRLLAEEPAAPPRKASDAASLPLFSDSVVGPVANPGAPANPVAPASPVQPAPPALQTASPPTRPAEPTAGSMTTSMAASARGSAAFDGFPNGMTRWLPWGAAALLVLALTFWLGSRWGGGAMDRAEVETIVRETILTNPEIVPQAFERHQANQIAATIDSIRPLLEKPFSGAWIGNAKGDVTLTIFTDYGCVFCRASVPDVDRLVREDKGVKVVFRELPIIAPQSKDAAIAALTAARQGKYDAFHHAMFAAPGLDRAAIEAASVRSGVILDGRSDANADVRLFEREIDNNLALAQQLGINGTPSWVVGSRLMQGAVGYGELKKAVAAARAAN